MKKLLALLILLVSVSAVCQVRVTKEGYPNFPKKPQETTISATDTVLISKVDGIVRGISYADFTSGLGGGTSSNLDLTGNVLTLTNPLTPGNNVNLQSWLTVLYPNLDTDSTNDFSGDYNDLTNKPTISNFSWGTPIDRNIGTDGLAPYNLGGDADFLARVYSFSFFTKGGNPSDRTWIMSSIASDYWLSVNDVAGSSNYDGVYKFNPDGTATGNFDVLTKGAADALYGGVGGGTDDQTAAEVPTTIQNGVTEANAQAELEKLNAAIGSGTLENSNQGIDADRIIDVSPGFSLKIISGQSDMAEFSGGGQVEFFESITIPLDPLDPGWDGNPTAATKDDIYDYLMVQSEINENNGKKHVVTISADATLNNENFAPTVTPNRGKTSFNVTTGDYTLTVPNTVTSETTGTFQPTDIDATMTFVPGTGVTFVGNGTAPITQGFILDSLNAAGITRIGPNLFSVIGAVKPFSTSYAPNNLYTEASGANADNFSAISIGSFTEQNGIAVDNISNSTEHPTVTGGATGSLRFNEVDDKSYNGLYLDFANIGVDLTIDEFYTLEVWVRKDSTTGSLRLRIDQTVDADINPTLTIGEWTKISITWQADIVNPIARIVPGWNVNTGSDDMYVTNYVIYQN
ncbi:MAG: hypothetical protein WBG90_18445 [Saonia sp.]